jgi:hypothetical protein
VPCVLPDRAAYYTTYFAETDFAAIGEETRTVLRLMRKMMAEAFAQFFHSCGTVEHTCVGAEENTNDGEFDTWFQDLMTHVEHHVQEEEPRCCRSQR